MRLRRSDPSAPGWSRRRRGKGFSYTDETGAPLTRPEDLERCRALVIPPAWRDVWICPDARGHIQAVGTDAAGRRQYRYHDVWRAKRDAAKFDHVLEVGEALPKVRAVVTEHLGQRGLTRDRVLAAAVRLLDVGCFRIGGEEYASGDDATFGLATLRREHVALPRGTVRFCYPAKGGIQRTLDVRDDGVRSVVRALLDRTDSPELLAYKAGDGYCDVKSADINAYLREVSGIDISAKDFRTWNGTVLAAVCLAAEALEGGRRTRTAQRRAVGRAMKEVSEYLGNTPTVARASYVDPRVIDLFGSGTTIAPTLEELGGPPEPADAAAQEAVEAAVLDLLRA
ncbi:DNA topoisomerase IB [Spirilliplanes yamanashiensis]|uniref:DNA topoisomerase n=1 Tax=Spirilliplanes yamanashiensis TaxID=42233 RepID=A0A8J4DIB9_9ACTN|nr:DNA topoisomerase IB [Spirilliplanes yamanashiensis]MDP9819362.1 DNA topoisomerase IB [Spirilliplanes yamanashiensis]GIJ01815.1 DNA topoisomerase [Spirilliplanes yamanashiensis]